MTGADWLRLCLLSVLWGGSFFFVGVAAPALPPLTIVVVRVGLAALVLAAALPILRLDWPRGRGVWAALAVMALLNNLAPFTLFVLAQGQIGSGLAAILNATTPLWGVLIAPWLNRDEPLTLARGLGVGLGFGGVVVMMGAATPGAALWPELACLAAALCYALAGVWGRRFRTLGLAPLSAAFGQVTCATVMLLPLVALIERPWTLAMPAPTVLAALVALAVLSTSLAYGLYFGLIARAGAVNATLVTFLVPVSALALGAAFLGESLAPRQIAGMALIALGLVVIDGRVWRRIAA